MIRTTILTLTVLTICTTTPVKAETVVDFGLSGEGGPSIGIIASPRRYRSLYPRYRYGWDNHPHYRIYQPRYRYGWDDHPRYRGHHQRYRRYGRRYYPRRSNVQIRIGF